MLKKLFVAGVVLSLALWAADAPKSFTTDTADIEWSPVEIPGLPPGLKLRGLHTNPETGMSSSMIRYPAGYDEPRHYHKQCGHYIYVLKGKLTSPDGDLTPGMFTYAAPGEAHGPYHATEETETLFYTDGELDFIVGEP